MDKNRGCVYFFRHIGLEPVKIGFSTNESPLKRFNQFKTYAPFGAELIGFIITEEPNKLEKELHDKFSNKKVRGEWYNITDKEIQDQIDFYSNIEDIKEKNEFQIEWAKYKESYKYYKNLKIEIESDRNQDKRNFLAYHLKTNKKINKARLARKLDVSRQTIHKWIEECS